MQPVRPWLVRLGWERGGALVVAVLVLYVWLAPPYIVDGDNAEFSTLGAIGGIAHPSGYPSYVLWLRAMSWLPGSSAAHTAALATVVLSVLHVAMLHAACRAWGATPTAATIAVAVFAAEPFAMRMYTEAEAYAGNGMVVSAVLWLAAQRGPLRGGRRAAALGLIAGLGLGNHLTCVLVAPVGVVGVVRGVREVGWRAAVAGVAGLAVGLASYLYLFFASENLLSWPRPHTFDELIAIFTRRVFGGTVGFMGGDDPVPVYEQLIALVASLGRAWLWALLPVGLATLGWRAVRSGAGESRAAWGALLLSFLIAGPLLVLRFDVPPHGFGLYVVRRFHILPTLLLTVPVAVGLDLGWRWLPERVRRAAPRAGIARALALAGFAVAAALSLPHVLAVHSPAMARGVHNMLRALPQNAVVVSRSNELHLGTRYHQLVEHERPDVVHVHWPAMVTRWYRDRLRPFGIEVPPDADKPSVALAEYVLGAGRPLLVDLEQGNILRAFPNYPYGWLVRVLPRGVAPPSLDEVVEENRRLYAAFELDEAAPGPDDEFAAAMHARYARTWQLLAGALARAGKREDAEWALALARQLAPN